MQTKNHHLFLVISHGKFTCLSKKAGVKQ